MRMISKDREDATAISPYDYIYYSYIQKFSNFWKFITTKLAKYFGFLKIV